MLEYSSEIASGPLFAEDPIVLIVDDEEGIRDECADLLSASGIACITVPSADEALRELVKHRSIHVVLTDIRMPGKSGFDLLQQVHLLCGQQYAVEVVIMSAYADALLEQHPARTAAAQIISKPLSGQKICDAVVAGR